MGYEGFAKVQSSVETSGKSPKQAAAIAAAIGQRKYGKQRMAAMAAQGRKRASKGK